MMARKTSAPRAGSEALVKQTLALLQGDEGAGMPLRFIRGVYAMQLLSDAADDGRLIDRAGSTMIEHARRAAGTACGSAGQVAAKLAFVVQQLAGTIGEETGPSDMLILTMAASALADLVVLGDRPIALPPAANVPPPDRCAGELSGRSPAEPQ